MKTPARKRAGVCLLRTAASAARSSRATTPHMGIVTAMPSASSSFVPANLDDLESHDPHLDPDHDPQSDPDHHTSAALALIDASPLASAPAHAALARFLRVSPSAGMLKSLLATVCGGAMLITAAIVLDPATLQAGSIDAPRATPPRESHQRFADALATLIAQSRSVLAINPASHDRGCEVILWLDDAHNPNVIDADELALIRHSPLFQTVTLYTATSPARIESSRRPNIPTSSDLDFSPLDISPSDSPSSTWSHSPPHIPATLSPGDIAAPGFIDRWRGLSAVQASVLMTGISDLQLTGIEGSKSCRVATTSDQTRSPLNDSSSPNSFSSLSPVRLTLTWSDDSADACIQATAAVRPPK